MNKKNGDFFFLKSNVFVLALYWNSVINYLFCVYSEHYEFTIEWNRDRLEKSLVKYHVTNSSIIIPSDGYYFLYCRLTFSSDAMQPLPRQVSIKHSIRIKPVNEHFQRLVTVSTLPSDSQSYIQRVVKLRKDEQLKVTISQAGKQHYDGSDVSSNYFGMFKL